MLKINKTISNKWPNAILVFFILVIWLASGCEQKVKSTLSDEEYARIASTQKQQKPYELFVGGETITSEEIIRSIENRNHSEVSLIESLKPIAKASGLEDFKQLARPEVEETIMNKISNLLLYQQAKRQLGPNADDILEQAVESEFRHFVINYGGDEARAEEALRRRGMDRQKFKEQQKRFILTKSYIESKLPQNRPVTHQELVQKYNDMKDEFFSTPAVLQFRLIDIQVAKVDITDPNVGQLERARELAKELVHRIRNSEDFGELAKQYSHGHRRELGGLWKPRDPGSLAEPYDILAVEAEKMQQGEVTEPIETDGHIFIMKLENRADKGYVPLEKVQQQLEQKILADRRREVFEELNAKLLKQAALGDIEPFIQFCLEQIYLINNE